MDRSDIRQREARDDDAAALARLAGETLPTPNAMRAAGGRLWVIEDASGVPVACGGVMARRQPGLFRLAYLAVAPQWRRRGLGSRLLLTANAFAAAAGAEALEAWVPNDDAEAAHGFLEANGMMLQPGIRARHDAGGLLECAYRLKPGFTGG